MIYEQDVDQAIAECQAERDPNAWTCIRLAAFLTIKQQLFGDSEQLPTDYSTRPMLTGASFAAGPQTPAEEIVQYTSGTEFGSAIDGQKAAKIWPIMDELMSIVQALYPDIYKRTMELVK